MQVDRSLNPVENVSGLLELDNFRHGANTMTSPVHLQNGDSLLVIVKDGTVVAHTWNISLSHAEFVRRTFGALPDRAWVGTIAKTDGKVMTFNSRTFYGNQLPAPKEAWDAVQAMFK